MQTDDDQKEYSEREAQKRFDAALRGALKTPHAPLKQKRESGKPNSRPASKKKGQK